MRGLLKNIIIISFCLLAQYNVFSQSYLEVKGRVVLKEGSVKEGAINLYENGKFVETILTDRSGKFRVDLEINTDYLFEFEEEGFVTKKISVNTEVPGKSDNKKFTPIYFAVELFKQYQGVNTFVFTQPVGIIKYYENIGDFDYDVDYSAEIRSKIDKAERELERAHQKYLKETREDEALDRRQQFLAQEEADAAERQRKFEAEKAAAEARKKAAVEAKIRKAEEQERLRKQQGEEADRRREEEAARKQAELEEKQRIVEQQRLEAEEKAKLKVEEEARKKAALEAKIKAEQEAKKLAAEAAAKAKVAAKVLLLTQQQEEAEKRKQEDEAKLQAELIEKQQIQEQQRIVAEERAKQEAEEEVRKRTAEEAEAKAQAETIKKAIEEKEKLEKQQLAEKLVLIKEEADKRKKEEEQVKVQEEIEKQAQLHKDLDERRNKALADKLKREGQRYKHAQEVADEFADVKNDYPKGKTVEEFEKFGMKITRVIIVDNKVVRIYLKVQHDWGETFFFKNNQCISQRLFDIEVESI